MYCRVQCHRNYKFLTGILEEAKYYGLEKMIPEVERIINFGTRSKDANPLSRRDVVNALMTTKVNSQLRFQGVNLEGADLSRLDLRNINFKVSDPQMHWEPLIWDKVLWRLLDVRRIWFSWWYQFRRFDNLLLSLSASYCGISDRLTLVTFPFEL